MRVEESFAAHGVKKVPLAGGTKPSWPSRPQVGLWSMPDLTRSGTAFRVQVRPLAPRSLDLPWSLVDHS